MAAQRNGTNAFAGGLLRQHAHQFGADARQQSHCSRPFENQRNPVTIGQLLHRIGGCGQIVSGPGAGSPHHEICRRVLCRIFAVEQRLLVHNGSGGILREIVLHCLSARQFVRTENVRIATTWTAAENVHEKGAQLILFYIYIIVYIFKMCAP